MPREPVPAVRHAVTIHAAGATPDSRSLVQATTAGGSRADGLFLPGAAPAAALLVPVAAGVVVEAAAAGIRVAGHAVAPGGRRLLRPGERAEIQGTALSLDGGSPPGGATRIAAAALLRDAAAGHAPAAGPRLVVVTGPAAGERHPLSLDQTLGRGRNATIRIPDPQASRVHARVRTGPEGSTIEDLRSKNGTRMNGVRLDQRPAPIRAGDEVAIGETLFVLEDLSPPPRTSEPGAPGPARRPASRRIPAHAAAAALLALSAVALVLAGT